MDEGKQIAGAGTLRRAVSVSQVQAAIARLAKSEGRIARRNARRAAFGAIRSLRLAVDREYPAIAKPAPAAQRLPKQPIPKLLNRTYEVGAAKLFLRIANSLGWLCPEDGKMTFDRYSAVTSRSDGLFIPANPRFQGRNFWPRVLPAITAATKNRRHEELVALFNRFYTEPIHELDIVLLAAHQQFLESLPRRGSD